MTNLILLFQTDSQKEHKYYLEYLLYAVASGNDFGNL